MAQNLKTIQIPAEVQLSVKDQAKAMRTIADNLHNIFSNADPGSAFAKSYAKAMAVVEKKLMSSDALLGKEFFSEADLSKVSKYLNDVAEKMAEMRILAQNTPTTTLGFETDELIEATKALTELQARIREMKNAKVGTIAGMNDKPAIKRMLETAEHSNFSTGKSFDENQAAMGKSIGKLSQQVRTYELEAERAKAASEEAEEAAQSAKTALAEAAEVLKAREAVNKKVASQVGAIDTKVSRKNNVTKTSIVQQYKDLISQQVVNGSWVDGGEDFARIIAGWLQIPQDALIGPAEDVVRNLHKAIGTAMRGSDISTNVLKRNAKSILDGESAALQQDASYREAESNVQIADAASQAATREAEDAQRVLANANNNLTQTQELLNKIIAQMEELRELQREYNRLVDANNADDLNSARQRKTQADRDSRQRHMPYVDEGVEGLSGSSRNVTNALSKQVQGRVEDQMRQNAAIQAQREAEQFKQNLQHTINQWMSAQQVINLVKDGIRQAYQDIQGLDAAMTNIAVVTDMSVSDLWGKINEYMSIAQQYGVTTQGVYEVSQLYYQQGLSTNEVMAATTETLKMARIAGMGYAEAADAMTVAIRAFKMEMGDASHVTDVYSKVAAVTASDTEELAIAMSKTASSAESVGSSFENTTAMLAVMVETTRESAQNLGSALKSIISRYGEMKQGLTQDSDGEIIDYNKTDAALRSIGISIKDAQGQFRDFDDVIFELSSKWDSLDKNTQRYIATIMAGNRQQSRFIALVDNWERLDEVATAAQDSEDAGLLQYAKTLDSLDTKINNLKTSFQQFYMSIFDGEFFKEFIDIVTNVVDNLSKMGPLLGGINLLQLINQIKLVGQLLLNTFSKGITKIQGSSQEWQKAFTNGWSTAGERIGDIIAKAIIAKAVPTGKEFVKGVKQGALNEKQEEPILSTHAHPLYQNIGTKGKRKPTIWQKANEKMLNFSPMTAGNFDSTGKRIEGIDFSSLSLTDNSFAKMHDAYDSMAQTILAAADKFDDTSVNWAKRVVKAGEKFGDSVDGAAKTEYRKELDAADIEAQKEIAAAEQAAAKQKARMQIGQGAVALGTVLSSAGMMVDQSTMKGYDTSTGLQAGGALLSVVGQAATGNYIGAAVTAITGVITAFQRISKRAEVELENAKKASETANAERASTKETYNNLQSLLKKYEQAQINRYNDEESYQEWLNVNNQIVEAYPELLGYIDAEGHAIADVTSKSEVLSYYMQKAAEASKAYYDAKIYETELALRSNREKETENISEYSSGQAILSEYGILPSSKRVKKQGHGRTTYYSYEIGGLVDRFAEHGINLNEILMDYNLNPELYTSSDGVSDDTLPEVLVDLGVFVKSGDSYVLSDSVKEYNDAYHQQNQLIGWRKGAAQQNLSLMLPTVSYDDDYEDLTGYNSLLYTYAREAMGMSDDAIRVMTAGSKEWDTLIQGYTQLYKNFSLSDRKMLNYLFENLDTLSQNEVVDILGDLGLEAGDDLYEAYMSQWYEKNYAQLPRWIESYYQQMNPGGNILEDELFKNSAFKDGLDIHAWIKNKAKETGDSETYNLGKIDSLYGEYYNELVKALTNGDGTSDYDPFYNFIKSYNDDIVESYLEYLRNDNALIASQGDGHQIAQKRQQFMTNIVSQMSDENSELYRYLAENEEARNEFLTVFFTDIGTYKWGSNVAAWGRDHDFSELANAEQYAYENYNTYIQGIIDSTSQTLNSLAELFDKQLKGFSWEESQQTLRQIQKIQPGKLWSQIFDINEQGLIVLKDFTGAADLLYLSSLKELQDNAAQVKQIRQKTAREVIKIDTADGNWTLEEINDLMSMRYYDGQIMDLTQLTQEQQIELIQKINEGTIVSMQQIVDWYNEYVKDIDSAHIISRDENLDKAFSDATDLSNYDEAKRIAQLINDDYDLGLDENSKEFQNLIAQIRNGEITSAETLREYYAHLGDEVTSANDVFAEQARSILADNSFALWSQQFTKVSTAKDLAKIASGSYEDLQSLWKKQLNEDQETILTEAGYELPKYQVGDQVVRDNQIITLTESDTDFIGRTKDINDWNSADYQLYYEAQRQTIAKHGASLDAFGNLIITDWEAWGEYIASSYGYSEKEIAAIQDKTEKAAAQEARNQILAEARASQIQTMESFNDSMEEGFTSILQNWIETGEVSFDDVKNIIDELQARGALSAAEYNNILDAYNNLTKGIGGSVEEFIRIISEAAADSGITYDVSAIQAAVEDAYANLIETLANALKNGIEGTLSATDFEALAKRYGLGEEDYINTATGRQLTRSGEAKTIAGMYNAAEASGSTYGLGAEVWKTLKDSGSQFQTYDDITKIIKEVETELADEADKWCDALGVTRAEAEACLEVFKQIQAEARLDPDNPLFNFMDKDPTKGYGVGIDEVVSSTNKAIDALKSLQNEEKIAAKDFYNIFDQAYLGKESGVSDLKWVAQMTGLTEEAVLQLSTAADAASFVYRDFVNGIMESHGKLGTIDGKVLANLGINITSMATGFGEGVKKVAEEQIKFLQGIRVFLVAMKEMSDLEDIKIPLSFKFFNNKGEESDALTLDDLINWNSVVSTNGWDKNSAAMSEATTEVKKRLGTIVENLDKALEDTPYEGLWNNIFTHFFGEDGFTGSIEDGNALSILMGFVRNFGTLTPDEQRAALAQLATQIFGPDGEFVENWQDIVYNYFKDFDKSKLRIQLKDSVVAELANLNIKVLNNEFILGEGQNWDDKLRTQVDAILAKQYGEDGFQYVVEGKKVTIVLIPEEVKTIINSPTVDETQWQWQESGENSGVYKRDIQVEGQTYTVHLSPSGEAVIVDTDGLPANLSDDVTKQVFTAAGFVQDENGVYVKPEGETTKFQLNIAPTTSGVEEEAKTITDIYNLLTGASDDAIAFKITINPEASGIAEILTKIKEAYEVLSQVSPVNFTVNGGLNIPKNNQNNPNFPLKPNYINVSLLPESEEELSSVVADLAAIDEPHTANIDVEISPNDTKALNDTSNLLDKIDTTNYSATIKAVKNTSSFTAIETALDNLTKPREVTITVKEEKENPATASGTAGVIGGGGGGLVNTIAVRAKGNVALAGGNVSNLLAGAAFARGTLMGELGPELYVQGGQYHIAGANGPEFVDLHNDAIVFNHLQTAKLLNKGHINSHGSPVTDERTAVALAAGNVSGPAHANSNIDDAIAAVDAAIAMWRNIANASINDMLNASKGGGGGGSDTIKAVTVELQEWYNLTRKIAEVEERINKLLAERENIERRDGAAYLRNLREEQQYWREQLTYQTVLAQYQSAQLDRQREAIEQSEIWGQFFKFDSQGNIQFRNGNERDDGKGTLEFLQDLKSMGLEDQIKAIEKLGYSYTDADGNKLEGKELVEQFLKDIDAQMKNYESLYDTVKQAETKIEQIKTNIEKVEQQIKENQMDLEQDIYDTIVEAQEKVIDGLEEQKDLIEEANKAYVDGLNNALKAEKDLYSKNESISDREQLQRQLSLLRRSGGSASEIAALEEQLNDMLKNEYFSNQEDMIKDIEEANKEQIRKLEEQIRLQEEALEYQKEHGLIWSQVADIMSHDSDYILDFLQGNSPDFFAQSMLQQEQMLTEWAHKIGIFTEDRLMQNFMDEEADMWEGDKPQIFNSMDGELGTGDKKTSYGDFFNSLSDDDKEVVKQSYLQAYASARKEGKTEEEARKIAQEAIKTILGSYYDASLAPDNDPPSAQPDPGSGGGENPPTTVTPRKVYLYYDYEAVDGTQVKNQRVNITTGSTNKEEVYQSLRNWANIRSGEREGNDKKRKPGVGVKTSMSRMRGFSEGGLVDYTGPAMVHGTPSKPEAFLNAQQTAMISEAVKASGDGGALDGIKATLAALNSTIKGIVNNSTNTTSSFTVAPGAVTIQVAELSDSYDVEELSKDVMNRIVAIASKSTNRGVNRR